MNDKRNDYPKYLRDLSPEELDIIIQYRIEQMKKISPEEWEAQKRKAKEILSKQKTK